MGDTPRRLSAYLAIVALVGAMLLCVCGGPTSAAADSSVAQVDTKALPPCHGGPAPLPGEGPDQPTPHDNHPGCPHCGDDWQASLGADTHGLTLPTHLATPLPAPLLFAALGAPPQPVAIRSPDATLSLRLQADRSLLRQRCALIV